MEAEELVRAIESGRLRPCSVLVGPDRYRADRAGRAIRGAARAEATAGRTLGLFSRRAPRAGAILAAARPPPRMGRARMVLLRDADELAAEELAALAPYLDDPNPTSVLVVLAERIDARRKLAVA